MSEVKLKGISPLLVALSIWAKHILVALSPWKGLESPLRSDQRELGASLCACRVLQQGLNFMGEPHTLLYELK